MSTKWTAEELVTAADEMGLRLMSGFGYFNPLERRGCACAIPILKAKPQLWFVDTWKHTHVREYRGLSSLTDNEFSGLSAGFEHWDPWPDGPPNYYAYYDLGREVRRIVDARTRQRRLNHEQGR